MAGEHPARLRRAAGRAIELPLQRRRGRPGRAQAADQGDRRDARALRLSAHCRCCCGVKAGQINAKRVYRLYRELGLQLRNKTPKRRVKAKLREDRAPATRSNEIWAMDFVHDQLATGRKIRVLTIVDTFSRSRRRSSRGSASVAPTSSRRWSVSAASRAAEGHPCRQGSGVRVARSRSVGLAARRDTRLLAAGQADRQRLHRVVQRQVPSRVPESRTGS